MSEEKKKAVVYCRVSTKEQVDEGNSLATQERICKEYLAKIAFEVVHVFIEKGESAKTTDRTELDNMCKFCADKKNKVDAVVAYKIDRIARNTNDYLQIKLLLKRYGVEIKSATEPIEDTPTGRFMENTLANVSQFDNDIRTERSVNGMKDAVVEGRYVWTAPTGYSNMKIGGKPNIVQNQQAAFVRKAFEEVAKNILPTEEIRRALTKEGLRTNRGKVMAVSHFQCMLRNPLYAGWIIKFNEKHRGLFEPIVSEALFDQVQRVLHRRKHRSLQYLHENPDFPLRRFMKHPSGQTLTGSWSKGRRKKYPYYTFKNVKMYFRKESLDTAFVAFLNQFRLHESDIRLLKQKLKKHLQKSTATSQKAIKQTQAYCNELKEKQRLLIDKNLKGIITDEILKRELAHIENELFRHSEALVTEDPFEVDYERLLDEVREFLQEPGSMWLKMPFLQKLKLQWFYFPKGIIFDGVKSRTEEICNVFKLKAEFLTKVFFRVPSEVKKTNNAKAANQNFLWKELGKEIDYLSTLHAGVKEGSGP